MALSAANSTDPYEKSEEPEPDRLGERSSSTPLMISYGGLLRILVLLAMAAFLVFGPKGKLARGKLKPESFAGFPFPPEIKIGGSHQFLFGGGATPFGALGVYTKMRPDDVTSPPLSEWAELDSFASETNVANRQGFFDALVETRIPKSLLITFDGQTTAKVASEQIGGTLMRRLGSTRAIAMTSALKQSMQDPRKLPVQVPEAGTQLYITCDRYKTHLAFGAPAEGAMPRNYAPIASSLADDDLPAGATCSALFDAFLGGESISPGVKPGIATGFLARFGRSSKDNGPMHEEL